MKTILISIVSILLLGNLIPKETKPSFENYFFSSFEDAKKLETKHENIFIENQGVFCISNKIIDPTLPLDGNLAFKAANGNVFIREEYLKYNIIRPEWFGAVHKTDYDDSDAFENALKCSEILNSKFVTSSFNYHISRVINTPKTENFMWEGNNATFDNTIKINGIRASIRDLNVINSPNIGFQWFRGQGGDFQNLTAKNCSGVGFLLGGETGGQVAWSTFSNLVSIGNESGFYMKAIDNKNWVNANNFIGLYARDNLKFGVKIEGKIQYNTWLGLHCENNNQSHLNIPVIQIDVAADNIFNGGHIVANFNDLSPVVIDNGRRNSYVGGRYVAGSNSVEEVIKNPNSRTDLSTKAARDFNDDDEVKLRDRSSETFLKVGKEPIQRPIKR